MTDSFYLPFCYYFSVCNAQIQVKVKNVTAIAGDEKVEIPCDYETDISGIILSIFPLLIVT